MPVSPSSAERPLSRTSLKYVVRNFTPAWFGVIMGTGTIASLFSNFPYDRSADAFKALSATVFFLNLSLFVLFNVLSIYRYILFPTIWSNMIHHPVQSMYVAAYPMGAATLLNVCVNLFYTEYGFGGKTFLYVIWGFWWVVVVLSCICCWGMIYMESTSQNHSLQSFNASVALPFVPPTVISSTGGALALAMAPIAPGKALLTATISLILLAIGLAFVTMAVTVLLLRLIIHGHPPGISVISTILPVGAFAQPGVSVLYTGQNFAALLPIAGSTSPFLGSEAAGETVYFVCVGIAIVLWAMTTAWLVIGLLAMQAEIRKHAVPFKLPFWGLIFPIGVYGTLTINLCRQLDAGFFRVYGAIVATTTLVLWLFVVGNTLALLRGGVIFELPCLEDMDIGQRRLFRRRDIEAVKDKTQSEEKGGAKDVSVATGGGNDTHLEQ